MAMLKYNEKFPAIAEDLAVNGESDERIAFRLQISMPTFYNYKAQFPEFAEALVVGRKVCYSRVRAKLLKLAQGRCTVLTEVYKDGELYKTIERQLPPNLKAIIYFQKHMRVGKITINENTLPQDDSNGRLSGELCWPHGHKTENNPAQRDSGISNLNVESENTLPQADSKMSNGRLSGVSCWPHGHKTENNPAQRDSGISNLKVESENTLPQADSKMSNGEESQTERTSPTCPTCPTAPVPENTFPQADSKMSNAGSPAALPVPTGLIGRKI